MIRINAETVQMAQDELAAYGDDPEWDVLSRLTSGGWQISTGIFLKV